MNKSKTFMTISIAILIVTIIASSITYAWYTWSTTSENETKIVTSMGAAKVFFDGGASITGVKLKPTADKSSGIVKSITVKTSKSATYKISFNLYLDIIDLDDGLKDASFKYALYKEGVETAVASGNFSNLSLEECTTNSTNHIVLVHDEAITTTTEEYTLYIWIDGTMDNPQGMQSQDFSFKLHADGQNAIIGETLVGHIRNLYTPNDTAENNGITYNLDTTHLLMNDRLGTNTVGINNGNIRYYGASPKNYIDIGDIYEEDTVINHFEENKWVLSLFGINDQRTCLTVMNCETLVSMNPEMFPNENTCKAGLTSLFGTYETEGICGTETIPAGTRKSLYRIIGLFKNVELADGTKKDLIKVVRNDVIGTYSWDQSPSDINDGLGINEWSQADLMKLLNSYPGNETVGRSLYWNSGSGTCYGYDYANEEYTEVPCNFTHKGLSASARGKIETVKWNLGGWNNWQVYPNQIYEYERGETVYQIGSNAGDNDTVTRKTVWPGKVALAYPSDYGYAVDLDSCDTTLDNYENCIGTNWMYPRLTFTSMIPSWLLTPGSSNARHAWSVRSGGDVYYGDLVLNIGGVAPVFYLDSALGIVTGDGSIETPFVVR